MEFSYVLETREFLDEKENTQIRCLLWTHSAMNLVYFIAVVVVVDVVFSGPNKFWRKMKRKWLFGCFAFESMGWLILQYVLISWMGALPMHRLNAFDFSAFNLYLFYSFRIDFIFRRVDFWIYLNCFAPLHFAHPSDILLVSWRNCLKSIILSNFMRISKLISIKNFHLFNSFDGINPYIKMYCGHNRIGIESFPFRWSEQKNYYWMSQKGNISYI